MDTDLDGMDIGKYRRRRRRNKSYHGCHKATVVRKVQMFADERMSKIGKRRDVYRNITDNQVSTVLTLMSFFLSNAMSCQEENSTAFGQRECNELVWHLCAFLLKSNKECDCKAWLREHWSELKTMRNEIGDSILHIAAERPSGRYPRTPLIKLLVEEGQLDVNAKNLYKQTPLHLICYNLPDHKEPTKDMKEAAEVLINSGAHMDVKDYKGNEASHVLSRACPQWSFNFNLKCLAAKVILKHDVGYENVVPLDMINFIQSHKPLSVAYPSKVKRIRVNFGWVRKSRVGQSTE